MVEDKRWPLRAIVGFDRDELGDHYALLACGHRRHMRHRPPLESRPWILSAEGQRAFLGQSLACQRCSEDGEAVPR